MSVSIYTDGAIKGGNPGGVGGWAYLAISASAEELIRRSGAVDGTTNNRMELQAVIEGLTWWHGIGGGLVTLCSDSLYVVNGAITYLERWKRRRWHTAAGKPVENKDQWLVLDDLRRQVTFKWVRGHSGLVENEIVDQLAVAASVRGYSLRRSGALVA